MTYENFKEISIGHESEFTQHLLDIHKVEMTIKEKVLNGKRCWIQFVHSKKKLIEDRLMKIEDFHKSGTH